jgi:hypothetical protein
MSAPGFTPDEVHNRFTYHPPQSEERKKGHEYVRQSCERLAMSFAGNLPHGRELSLAITKLEEAMFWANASLARAQDPNAPQNTQGA